MNPACNDCLSYPFDCDGAEDGANIAGCITLPPDTTYNSAMIEDDEGLSFCDATQRRRDAEDDADFFSTDNTDRVSLYPVDPGRDREPPADQARMHLTPGRAGPPAGPIPTRGARPFGFCLQDNLVAALRAHAANAIAMPERQAGDRRPEAGVTTLPPASGLGPPA